METIKLCKDCKHYVKESGVGLCFASGKDSYSFIERKVGKCKDGKLFEPKPIAKSKIRAIIEGMQTKLKELFK